MKRALLFVNDIKPAALRDYNVAVDFLESIGWEYTRIPMNSPQGDYEFGLVFGGDGTFLWAADIFSEKGLPMAGINTGTLGFLTTIQSEEIIKAIGEIIDKKYHIEECMMINVHQSDDGTFLGSAMNDVVFKNKMEHNVGHFRVYVNGTKLYDISADGVIVAAPTGSTAYVLSLGGPVVDTRCRIMIIQPIAPHTLNSRAVVVNENDEITVEFDKEKTSVSRDGRMIEPVCEKFTIRKSDKIGRIIRFDDYDFFKVVSEKFNRG